MRQLYFFTSFLFALVFTTNKAAAQSWPASFSLSGGDRLKMYEPQPSEYGSGELVFQSAIALYRDGSDEPVFGTLWAKAYTQDQSSYERIMRMNITGIKFPAEIDESASGAIARSLEQAVEQQQVLIAKEQLKKNLDLQQQKEKLAGGLNNQPPKVIYRNKPSLMVVVDGNPIWQKNENWGLEAVVNTPNTIVKHTNGKIYVYGGNHWYVSNNLDQPFSYASNPPSGLDRIAADIKTATEKNDQTDSNNEFETDYDEEFNGPVAEVIVSREPAELIQSRGEADFTPISSTNLLFVENSPNDIFMDVSSQQYFVLLSGRWYRSSSLKGNWMYIPAEQLPADFAKIPAGSSKDNVLASVAGTPAANNALMDAQLPQTARVDRNSATASVQYDGDPEFQSIEGTRMDYAVNTSATVIRYKRNYYLVDNGVWFQSNSALGPWRASTVRPDEVDLIPANNPVYPVKYVYIYDVSPDYIYMGYTPGYLNTFVYGPTVVYGTGFYYRPWHRNYYFPRPYTWGFNMHYTPWYGWSVGFRYNPGWFHVGFGYRPWNHWYGGWWGPSVYRPAYCAPRYRHYGYYGYRNNTFIVNNHYYGNNYRNYRYNNVYRSRPAITSRDTRRYYGSNYNNRNYNNRNNNTPGARPNRNYYGTNRDRQYNNNNRPQGNNTPGRVNPNQPNRNPSYSREGRPERTYRPGGNSNANGNRPGQRSEERPAIARPNNPQRYERRERPQISRQEQPSRRPEVRREAPPSRPSGNAGGQRGGGGVSRPERRGN